MLIPMNQLNSPGPGGTGTGNGANPFKQILIPVVNRTGSTLTQYGVYQLDIVTAPQAEGTDFNGYLSNIIAVSTAGIAAGIIGVAQTAAVDNALTMLCIGGVTDCTVDNSAILIGSALMAANAASTAQLVTTPGTTRVFALSLAANGSAAVTQKILVMAPFGTK